MEAELDVPDGFFDEEEGCTPSPRARPAAGRTSRASRAFAARVRSPSSRPARCRSSGSSPTASPSPRSTGRRPNRRPARAAPPRGWGSQKTPARARSRPGPQHHLVPIVLSSHSNHALNGAPAGSAFGRPDCPPLWLMAHSSPSGRFGSGAVPHGASLCPRSSSTMARPKLASRTVERRRNLDPPLSIVSDRRRCGSVSTGRRWGRGCGRRVGWQRPRDRAGGAEAARRRAAVRRRDGWWWRAVVGGHYQSSPA